MRRDDPKGYGEHSRERALVAIDDGQRRDGSCRGEGGVRRSHSARAPPSKTGSTVPVAKVTTRRLAPSFFQYRL